VTGELVILCWRKRRRKREKEEKKVLEERENHEEKNCVLTCLYFSLWMVYLLYVIHLVKNGREWEGSRTHQIIGIENLRLTPPTSTI
jgi:hypothetical protein